MKSKLFNKITVTLLIITLGRPLLAQEIKEPHADRPWQKKLAPIEILAGGGLVYLRQGPPDPHRQDVVTLGYTFGIASRLAVSRRFQIEGMILYESKGGKQYDDEQTADTVTHLPVIHNGAITTKHVYHCVTLPIAVGYHFGKNLRFQIKAGAYFSYLLNAEVTDKSSVTAYQSSNDITNLLNNDFGYLIAFGYEVPLSKKNKFSILVTSNTGLINIAKSVNPSYPIEWKTNSVFITIGFPIREFL